MMLQQYNLFNPKVLYPYLSLDPIRRETYSLSYQVVFMLGINSKVPSFMRNFRVCQGICSLFDIAI